MWKYFLTIFRYCALLLAFGCIFGLQSENASAFDYTSNMRINQVTIQRNWQSVQNTSGSNEINGPVGLGYLQANFQGANVTDGQFFEFTFPLYTTNGLQNQTRIPLFNNCGSNSWFSFGQEVEEVGNTALIHIYGYISGTYNLNYVYLCGQNNFTVYSGEQVGRGYMSIYGLNNSDVNVNVNIDSSAIISAINNLKTSTDNNGNLLREIRALMIDHKNDYEDWKDEIIDAIGNGSTQKEQSAAEEAQQDAQDDADSSGEDAENAGTTLLGALTAFVGAITSAQPSNCNINADLGHMNLGNINLCQLSLPSSVQVISSIILIAFCVPLSIALAKKMISLFRSFQN